MFFRNHKKKAFEIMQERNRLYLEKMKTEGKDPEQEEQKETEESLRHQEEYRNNNDLGLEKGDLPAIILSAFLVFGPIFLVLIGILVVAWIFLH